MLISLAYGLLWVATISYVVLTRTYRSWTGWVASGATTVSLGLLTVGLVRRGMEAGHWPLTNRYEFSLCFAWAIIAIYLLLEASWGERRAGVLVLPVALLVATYAVIRRPDERSISLLLPALRSPWLPVHVLSTMIGYGALGVAAGLGLVRLAQSTPSDGSQHARRWLYVEAVEHTMERAVVLGFPWLTLGILSGAIWAQRAWGRYWGWDPKETWALVTWLWYLLILHVCPLRSWRGRRLAALIVMGFGVVLFTFIGVPWLVRTVRLESLHGF